jgi:adenylate cyclase class 2
MSNKLEQEVKFYLNDLKALENKLVAAGARLKQPRTLETNLRFDTPDQRLSKSFQVLRLRQDTRARLTHKSAGYTNREVSAREELEVEVSDLDTARKILESLGYEVTVMYEKYRTAYEVIDVEISLDEMPFGTFCEVEGPDTDSIRQCAENLGLNWGARSKLSYLAIFSAFNQNFQLEIKNITFEAFKGITITSGDLGVKPAD